MRYYGKLAASYSSLLRRLASLVQQHGVHNLVNVCVTVVWVQCAKQSSSSACAPRVRLQLASLGLSEMQLPEVSNIEEPPAVGDLRAQRADEDIAAQRRVPVGVASRASSKRPSGLDSSSSRDSIENCVCHLCQDRDGQPVAVSPTGNAHRMLPVSHPKPNGEFSPPLTSPQPPQLVS